MLLVIVLVTGMLPITARAATEVSSGKCGNKVSWVLMDDGILTISGEGAMTDFESEVYIPWNGFWVDLRERITTVVIEDGVTTIGDRAFYGCKNLTGVTIPGSVTDIGEFAFSGCRSLTSISISDSVTSIGNHAFQSNGSLEGIWVDENNSVFSSDSSGVLFNKEKTRLIAAPGAITGTYSISDCVTDIEAYAFYNCDGLSSVTIGNSVTTISDYAFYRCLSLSSVTIPNSVTTIGNGAFCTCMSLDNVIIPDSVTSIGDDAFSYCYELTEISFGDGISVIPDDLLDGCSNLRCLNIGSGVLSIDIASLFDCANLTEIRIDEHNACYSNDDYGVLYDKEKTSLLFVPNALSGEYTVANSTKTIDECAFYRCNSVTRVMIPDSVTAIGEEAFRSCGELTEICVDDNNAYYSNDGAGALFDKNKTLLISIPGAFRGIYTVPESVTDIAEYAFYGCSHLTSVNIADGVVSVPDYAFYGCKGLTSVTLPQSITKIGWWSFAYSGITKITIPENVSYIDRNAFCCCYSLKEIVFEWGPPRFRCLDYDDCKNVGAFRDVVATAYYPANDPFWTNTKRQNYGGTITWVPYEPEGDHDGVNPELEGSGTKDAPYRISSPDQLAEIQKDMAAYYILTEDLDFTDHGEWEPLGTPARPFTGSIDGNGKSITNISIGSKVIAGNQYAGLFAAASGAEFTNMVIEGLSVDLCGEPTDIKTFAGALVALNSSSEIIIRNCNIDRTISVETTSNSSNTTAYVGGLVGYTSAIVIEDSQIGGNVTCSMAETYERSSAYVGGCVGYASNGASVNNLTKSGNVDYCISQGTVYGYTGGISGYCGGTAYVQDCTYTGDVRSEVAHQSVVILVDALSYLYAGGLFGKANSYFISNGSVDGNVSALLGYGQYRTVGGLIGVGNDGNISDSSFSGTIRGTAAADLSDAYAGGLIGVARKVTVSGSSVTGQINNRGYYKGRIYTGGLAGYASGIGIVACHADCTMNSSAYDGANPTIYEGEWVGYSNSLTVEDQAAIEKVCYFHSWDAENQIAYFDSDPLENPANLGSQVTEETDTSFLENVDEMVGTYVLVKTNPRDDGMIAPDTLISITPVETYTGTITAIGNSTFSIDDVTYSVAERLYPLFFSVGDQVIYHLYEGEIVGISEYDDETPIPDNPALPEPAYEFVLTPNGETMSVKAGEALRITCELFCDGVRVEEWEQPDVSISHGEATAPLNYEGWEQLWAGSYVLTLDAVSPGNAYVTISESTGGMSKTVEVVVTAEQDCSNEEWIAVHREYAESNDFKAQIVQGFTGELQTVFEQIKENDFIDAYNTLDSINTILDFDLDLTDSQEYELLLAQILFTRNGVTSIEKIYDEYLPDAVVQFTEVLLEVPEFLADLDEEKLNSFKNAINMVKSLTKGTEEYRVAFDSLLSQLDLMGDFNFADSFAKACDKAGFKFAMGLYSDQFFTTCDSLKQLVLYMAAAEAYCDTADVFGNILLSLRKHIAVESDDERFTPYPSDEMTVSDTEILISLGVENADTAAGPDPLNCPIHLSVLARAIEDFYLSLENSKMGDADYVASRVGGDYAEATLDNLLDAQTDVALSLFECIPVVKAFDTISKLFDGTQFAIDVFTTIDTQAYHGTMVKRLYAIAYIHYLSVENYASADSWNMIPENYSGTTEEYQFDRAMLFDEAVTVYRAILETAADYAIEYETAFYNAIDKMIIEPSKYGYPEDLTHANIAIEQLRLQKYALSSAWCHQRLTSENSQQTIQEFDSSNLLVYGMKCPIEVTVKDDKGNVIAFFSENKTESLPGYEHYFYISETINGSGDYVKIVIVPDTYEVSILGTGTGAMDALVGTYANGELGNTEFFFDIPVTEDMKGAFVDSSAEDDIKDLEINDINYDGEAEIHVHRYLAANFVWTDDYTCRVSFACEDGDYVHDAVCAVTSNTIPATETEDGQVTYTAAIEFNGQTYEDSKSVVIPATGHVIHTTTLVPAVDATCEHTGNVAYYTCSGCDLWFEDAEATKVVEDHNSVIIPLTPHTYKCVVTASNCTEQGYTTYICTVCGESSVDDYVDALGHDFSDWVVIENPSTAEEGLEERTCDRCGCEETRPILRLDCPFTDVPADAFYYEPVIWALENSITNGTTATTFAPNAQCMRAHVVTFLWRALGCPEPTRTDNPFLDVSPDAFYYEPVLWALENGITSGMDATHFGPTAYCNRAQVVTFLYRTMDCPAVGSTDNPFADVPTGQWFTDPVLWAVENNITNGLNATAFGPNSVCNRAQIVTFLYRAFVTEYAANHP